MELARGIAVLENRLKETITALKEEQARLREAERDFEGASDKERERVSRHISSLESREAQLCGQKDGLCHQLAQLKTARRILADV